MKKTSLFLLLIIVLFFLQALSGLEEDRTAEGIRQLEDVLRQTAVSCYGAEGFYPPNVAYMQEHYGLQFDQDAYVIHYKPVASNWMPKITVLERDP